MTLFSMTAVIPEWDLADRMRKSLRESEFSAGEMAEYLGVGRTTVSTWLNGHVEPRLQTLRLWALRTGVPFEWLCDGHPGVRQAAQLARATDLYPELRADYDGEQTSDSAECAARDLNPQPAD